ncbi:MAG: nitroreductase family protein [Clostridia bacterium]|nr:nitroreductase family protein [Clostridia bacterium]
MEYEELILKRRSIRSYEGGVPEEDLRRILARAQQAPSWKNWQASRCHVVTSPELLEAVRSGALPAFNAKNAENATLVVSTYVKDTVGFTEGVADNEVGNGWGAYDLGLRDAYLVLAASDLGYDSLIMGLRDASALRRLLNIPENEVILSVIALGKGKGEAKPRPRKPLEEVATFQ